MKILAIEHETPGALPGEFAPHLEAEATQLWKLYQSDLVREFYFRGDRSEAVLMLECVNLDQAQGLLDSLPLVKAGLVRFELIPLNPYPGFARLFSKLPN